MALIITTAVILVLLAGCGLGETPVSGPTAIIENSPGAQITTGSNSPVSSAKCGVDNAQKVGQTAPNNKNCSDATAEPFLAPEPE